MRIGKGGCDLIKIQDRKGGGGMGEGLTLWIRILGEGQAVGEGKGDLSHQRIDHVVLVLGLPLPQLQAMPQPPQLRLHSKPHELCAVETVHAVFVLAVLVRVDVRAAVHFAAPEPVTDGVLRVVLGGHVLDMSQLPKRQALVYLGVRRLLLLVDLGTNQHLGKRHVVRGHVAWLTVREPSATPDQP